jgi:starch phosphorylase
VPPTLVSFAVDTMNLDNSVSPEFKLTGSKVIYFPIEQDEDLKRVVDLLESGHFNQFEPGIFDDILNAFTNPYDPWMTVADFRSYIDAQHQAGLAYQDRERWLKMSIINSANSGKFSTDRTMEEYNDEIWKLEKTKPVSI